MSEQSIDNFLAIDSVEDWIEQSDPMDVGNTLYDVMHYISALRKEIERYRNFGYLGWKPTDSTSEEKERRMTETSDRRGPQEDFDTLYFLWHAYVEEPIENLHKSGVRFRKELIRTVHDLVTEPTPEMEAASRGN